MLGELRGNFASGYGHGALLPESLRHPGNPQHGGERGERQGGRAASIQVCRGEAERKFRESVKILREKSGNSSYRRLVHIECL